MFVKCRFSVTVFSHALQCVNKKHFLGDVADGKTWVLNLDSGKGFILFIQMKKKKVPFSVFRLVHLFMKSIFPSVGLLLSFNVGQQTISHGSTPTIICHLLL